MSTLEKLLENLGNSISDLTSHVKQGRNTLFKAPRGDTGASGLRGQDSYEVDVQKATEGLTGGFARGHLDD